MGTASAGRGAIATDASIAGVNPAGMTKLNRSQLLVTTIGLFVDSKFKVDSAMFGGGNGKNNEDFTPGASFHYVYSATPSLKLGISAASNFGFGSDYDDDWAGRYYILEAKFTTFLLNPGIGYRVNKWLSLGGGLGVMYANLENKTAINNQLTDPGFPDGKSEFEDDDVGFGFNLGTLIEPRDDTRFSITYRSEVEFEFKDDAELKGLGPTLQSLLNPNREVKLEMTMPQSVVLSGYHDLTDKLALVASVSWQDWSEFGQTSVTVQASDAKSFEVDNNFKDTWHGSIGAQYRIADVWLWSVGFAYDSSPLDDEDRSPDFPMDRQIRLGTGLQYDWNEDITVGAAYTYVDTGDAEIDWKGRPLQGDIKGDYDPHLIHAFALNLIWRF
jgi:long-chain fatty acid transport protein